MVGFVPLFGASTMPADAFDNFPQFQRRREWFIKQPPGLDQQRRADDRTGGQREPDHGSGAADQFRRMLLICSTKKSFSRLTVYDRFPVFTKRILWWLNIDGQEFRLGYEPGESVSDALRRQFQLACPIWMPVNFMILLSLKQYHRYYGDSFQVECPTGSGNRKKPW